MDTYKELGKALARNRKRRERADAEAEAARRELEALLAQGANLGADVSGMARDAGISRETAHKRLRAGRTK
jgi:transcriptional regulator of acetoin/glycerol metabolism